MVVAVLAMEVVEDHPTNRVVVVNRAQGGAEVQGASADFVTVGNQRSYLEVDILFACMPKGFQVLRRAQVVMMRFEKGGVAVVQL